MPHNPNPSHANVEVVDQTDNEAFPTKDSNNETEVESSCGMAIGEATVKLEAATEPSLQPKKKKIKLGEGSSSGKSVLLTKPIEMRSFTGEALDLWNSLHVGDGSGFSWSCVGNPMLGKRYRRDCPTLGRLEGFLVAWAKVRLCRFRLVSRAFTAWFSF
jgi:hypothetical protein